VQVRRVAQVDGHETGQERILTANNIHAPLGARPQPNELQLLTITLKVIQMRKNGSPLVDGFLHYHE
jgi:hypothetical protein